MKRITALSLASLMGASLFAAPALSQISVDVGSETGIDVGIGDSAGKADTKTGLDADVRAGGIDTTTTAAIDMNVDSVVSSIERNSDNANAIGSMAEVSTVTVVRIADLEGDASIVSQAASQNSASVDELRAALTANSNLEAALDAESVDVSSVVAADVAADGSLVVYVM